MQYLSVAEVAEKWNISERSVRNYCAHNRVEGAFITGKTWNILENAEKPERSNKKREKQRALLDVLQEKRKAAYSGGIYYKTQIELTYHSNRMEGSNLSCKQTRYIFETNTMIDNGKVFATQRGYGEFKDGWEFPGGKIDAGETPEEALIREIKEELDTEVEVLKLLDTVEYDYPKFHLSMDCFICKIKSGDLVLKEHEASAWLIEATLYSVNWLPAEQGLIPLIEDCL